MTGISVLRNKRMLCPKVMMKVFIKRYVIMMIVIKKVMAIIKGVDKK